MNLEQLESNRNMPNGLKGKFKLGLLKNHALNDDIQHDSVNFDSFV